MLKNSILDNKGSLDFFDERLWFLLVKDVLVKRNQILEFIYHAGFKNEI